MTGKLDALPPVPAVVLRTQALGDADLLVVLLTPEQGKVEAVARAARNSRRRFPGGFPGGLRGLASLRPGRSGGSGWQRLEAFQATSDHTPVGQDLDRFAYVAYLCELTDVLVMGRQADPWVFACLCQALAGVIDQPPQPGQLRRYELALLQALGLLPALRDCCVCGQPVVAVGDRVGFAAARGGVTCPDHSDKGPGLDAAVWQLAQGLAEGGDPEAIAGAPDDVRRGLRDLTQASLRLHLRRPLRSLAFFAALPRPRPGAGEASE